MKVIEPGHVYQLEHLDGSGAGILVFVNREDGTEHEGTQTQEVLRALIDRTQHCDNCLRWAGNDEIVMHLRQALVLHEARALERKTVKGCIEPEKVPTGPDGHFALTSLSRMYECGVCGKVDGCMCSGGRQPKKTPMGEVREYPTDLCRRCDAPRRNHADHGAGVIGGPRVTTYCARFEPRSPVPKCALQADSCKAADCFEHGWVNRNPKVMRLGEPAKTWVRSRDDVWHAQRGSGVACGAFIEPMTSRDVPVLGDLVCTTCLTLYPTYGTPVVGSGG